MDSLTAVELRNHLQAGIKQPLPTTLAFEYPTIEALTRYLAGRVLALENTASVANDKKVVAQRHTLSTENEAGDDSWNVVKL